MELSKLEFKNIYRSLEDDILSDFLMPTLLNSKTYDRAVGYFSSSSLAKFTLGLVEFIENGGKMRVVCSPILQESDFVNEITHSIDREIVIRKLTSSLNADNEEDNIRMNLISNLLSAGILELKIAYKSSGIYHEKIGLFGDGRNVVCFSGSLNETNNAYTNNYEEIKVFKSWKSDFEKEMCSSEYAHFEKLWSNKIVGLETFDLPTAIKEKIIQTYEVDGSIEEALNRLKDFQNRNKRVPSPEVEVDRKLYPFQEQAIRYFFENDCSGFFQMATGTGKTFTSVNLINQMLNRETALFVLILVPQIDLQSQWVHELNRQGIYNVLAIGGDMEPYDWENQLRMSLISNKTLNKSSICVSTYRSFTSKISPEIHKVLNNLFIIIDEAHNITSQMMKHLPHSAPFKLGLSATPTRWDKTESRAIDNYFLPDGRKSFIYSIEDAIKNAFLSKYKYYPILVELEQENFESYKQLSKRYASLLSNENTTIDELNNLLNLRSLLIKKSYSKIEKLDEMLKSKKYDFKNSVIYCGQGTNEDGIALISEVTKLLGESEYTITKFVQETENRQKVLKHFESGEIDTLVALKCLDEGVDVPRLDKIYLLSSDSSTRQTIQRRGRVLRICKETGKKIAYIYDFVAIPPATLSEPLEGKTLVRNELIRVNEYARLSENFEENTQIIATLEKQYSITEEDYIYDGEI